MKKNKLAFILAVIAGLICLGNFIYKLIRFQKTDYSILAAGIFIIALGASAYFKKRE
jgi:hypothetical protein